MNRGHSAKIVSIQYITYIVNSHRERLRAAGIQPAPALLEAISSYCDLLLRWNRKINLTTITDPLEILERNFVESFYGALWLTDESGVLCDVGSGAGFPGLALKLVRPGWDVRLYEPNQKKAAFLAEVARQLRLTGLDVVRERWGDVDLPASSLDAVTARAVGSYEAIAHKAWPALGRSGKLLLWIGAADVERISRMAGWRWETKQVPGSRGRILLAGTPMRAQQ